jgi:hypothetical protein
MHKFETNISKYLEYVITMKTTLQRLYAHAPYSKDKGSVIPGRIENHAMETYGQVEI